jgi:hypothetical protein
MSWLKIDDGYPTHRRVRSLGRDVPSKWLHTTALCYCARHLTDGRLDQTDIALLIAEADMPKATATRSIGKLVDVGLWAKTGEFYELRDYLDYNPSAQEVKEKRLAAAERQRRSRVTHASVTGPRPVPSQTHISSSAFDVAETVDRSLRSVQ